MLLQEVLPEPLSMIGRIVQICEIVNRFFQKLFWFFQRYFWEAAYHKIYQL